MGKPYSEVTAAFLPSSKQLKNLHKPIKPASGPPLLAMVIPQAPLKLLLPPPNQVASSTLPLITARSITTPNPAMVGKVLAPPISNHSILSKPSSPPTTAPRVLSVNKIKPPSFQEVVLFRTKENPIEASSR
jgi:hypothetical protein